MAHSHYRGKLSTSKEIKGVFTEAKDDFSEGFDILASQLVPKVEVKVFARPLHPAKIDEILFTVGDIWVVFNRDGLVEIGEGGA